MLLTAVIDPNIVVSALIKPTSPPAGVLAAVAADRLVPIMSPILAAEIDRATAKPKLRRYFSLADGWAARWLLQERARWYADPPATARITRDPADDYLVRLARAADADAIVTGDQDLHAAGLADVRVLTPRHLLDELEQR